MIDFEDPPEVVEQRLKNARKRRFQAIFFLCFFSLFMGVVLLLDYDVIMRLNRSWRGGKTQRSTLHFLTILIGVPVYLAARHFATKRYGNDDDVV